MSSKKPTKGAKKTRTPSLRRKLLDEGVLQGKSRRKAALDAGYAESTANVNFYKPLEKTRTQQVIEARIREAQIDTNEIIGTLVSHMRGDLADVLPRHKILQEARAAGVSHLIKEIEVTEQFIVGSEDDEPIKEVKTKIKIHDSQSAAKHLTNVFGLEKLPAPNPEVMRKLDEAVDRFIKKAAAKGIEITPEQARAKLMPLIQSNAVS